MSRSAYVRALGSLLLIAAAVSSGQAGMNRQPVTAYAGGQEGPNLRTIVRPAVAKAPAELRIEVWVAANDDNRAVEIALDSGEFYRSSEIALDGAQAAQSFTVEYRAVPAGDYEVLVRLRARQGIVRALERHAFQVAP